MRLSDYIEDSALGRPRYLYITDKLKKTLTRWHALGEAPSCHQQAKEGLIR